MATVFGPGQTFSQFRDEFMKELEDDFQGPGSSKFQNYMPHCRAGMQQMEEVRTGSLLVHHSRDQDCACLWTDDYCIVHVLPLVLKARHLSDYLLHWIF